MDRRVIAPEQWGTQSGYAADTAWAEGLDAFEFSDQGPSDTFPVVLPQGPASFDNSYVAPHYDHARVHVASKSWRLWDPLRAGQSIDGLAQNVASPLRPQLTEIDGGETIEIHPPVTDARGAKILGVKGELEFRFTNRPLLVNDGGEPESQFQFFGRWVNETGALQGQPWHPTLPFGQDISEPPPNPYAPFYAEALDGENGAVIRYDPTRLFMARVPVFVAMYKGTIKVGNFTQADFDDAGPLMTIDSGPIDDPATTIGMDITNPFVLESKRVVWWDKFDAWLPVPIPAEAVDSDVQAAPQLGGVVKYPLNLDRNWRVDKDQVLWLHIMTGAVRVPVLVRRGAGPFTWAMEHATYIEHPFTTSLQATMLIAG